MSALGSTCSIKKRTDENTSNNNNNKTLNISETRDSRKGSQKVGWELGERSLSNKGGDSPSGANKMLSRAEVEADLRLGPEISGKGGIYLAETGSPTPQRLIPSSVGLVKHLPASTPHVKIGRPSRLARGPWCLHLRCRQRAEGTREDPGEQCARLSS